MKIKYDEHIEAGQLTLDEIPDVFAIEDFNAFDNASAVLQGRLGTLSQQTVRPSIPGLHYLQFKPNNLALSPLGILGESDLMHPERTANLPESNFSDDEDISIISYCELEKQGKTRHSSPDDGHFQVLPDLSSGSDLQDSGVRLLWRLEHGSGRDQVNCPWDVHMGEDGVVYVADTGNSRLLVVPPDGDSNCIESEVGGFQPERIVVTPDGTKVLTDGQHKCVQILTPGATCWRRETPLYINNPIGLAFNSKYERWYISDFDSHKIGVYDKEFQFIGFARGLQEHIPVIFDKAWYLCCDSMDHLLVSDGRGRAIYTFDVDGRYISHFDPSTTLSVQFARGICRGMGDELYIADQALNMVRSFNLNGQQSRTILSAEHGLEAPVSISCAKSVSGDRRERHRIAVCSAKRSTVALYAIDD